MSNEVMSKVNGKRTYNLYEVYFRRDGEKKFVWVKDKVDVQRMRNELKRNHRKFLGSRAVTLQEVM